MASSFLHSGAGARIARAGAIAITLALGAAWTLGNTVLSTASAQGAKKTDKDKAAAAPTSTPEGSWVKLCDKGQLKSKDKDGKEVAKDVDACVTLSEQIHPDSGLVMVSARLQQVKMDGQEKQLLKLTVPLGVALPFGAGITIFPKDLWEKAQKNATLEKAEEEKLKAASVKLSYTFCGQAGCNAEVEANADLVNKLKGGAGFIVQTVHVQFGPVAQPVSLQGFPQALANPPTETKKFEAARTELMKEIYERRKQMLADLKAKQDELNKMQPNVAPEKKAEPKKK